MDPKIIVIAGAGSNTGKTTLLCELLRAFASHEACEAIKLTRGHYRSCGKDPHACCVSHLLSAAPVVRSGRAETYALGKDTGRYWDVGASNVHWVIATDSQVEQGINQALTRVQSRRVLIEGTSLLSYVKSDLAVLVLRQTDVKLKPSARRALTQGRISAVYCSDVDEQADAHAALTALLQRSGVQRETLAALPLYARPQLPQLLALSAQV
jgi:molybdopterin-guanine dinucleotide biosynthesis protein